MLFMVTCQIAYYIDSPLIVVEIQCQRMLVDLLIISSLIVNLAAGLTVIQLTHITSSGYGRVYLALSAAFLFNLEML